MIKHVMSVYDTKARTYSNPFYAINQDVAVRDFQRAATDPNSEINRFPEDYTLSELGVFDDETASIDMHQNPIILCRATQFIKG